MKKILSSLLLGLFIIGFNTGYVTANTTTPVKSVQTKTTTQVQQPALSVKPLDVVNNPSEYMRKRICMTGKFSKFSTLGLDYKPAFRSSDKYISFLFFRDDVVGTIPLSELKMFISRKVAEKLPDINEGDTIKVTGTVFSNALGDAWFDAENIQLIHSNKK